jgi:hypothetical protein
MWIFTETGFVSAVANIDDDASLVVRSRDRQSLESLAALDGDQIIVGAGSDYPYRLLCTRTVFTTWLASQVSALDYPNFKSRVHDTRGDTWASALLDVWSAMCDVTDSAARGR